MHPYCAGQICEERSGLNWGRSVWQHWPSFVWRSPARRGNIGAFGASSRPNNGGSVKKAGLSGHDVHSVAVEFEPATFGSEARHAGLDRMGEEAQDTVA